MKKRNKKNILQENSSMVPEEKENEPRKVKRIEVMKKMNYKGLQLWD
jgi:hypothetical protein